MRFVVAVYERDRAYGGPEEGGWWYDTGDLVRVMSVEKTEARAYERCRRINRALEAKRETSGIRPLSSVAYAGGHLEAEVFENVPPEHYPAVRPHYE